MHRYQYFTLPDIEKQKGKIQWHILTIEQFTSRKDKNRKDIYSGDILKSLHFIEANGKKHYLYHIVLWGENKYMFICVSKNNYKIGDRRLVTNGNLYFYVYLNNLKEIEVVGNINENPELLK